MEEGCNFVERRERERERESERKKQREREKNDLIESLNLEQPKVGYSSSLYK